MDLYRVESREAAHEAGLLDTLFSKEELVLVEWVEVLSGLEDELRQSGIPLWEVRLSFVDGDPASRHVEVISPFSAPPESLE
jgi:hypothetical protein